MKWPISRALALTWLTEWSHWGDAGHILISKHVAEDLEEYQRWRPFLHDIGRAK